MIAIAVVLALIWSALQGEFSAGNLLGGFLLSLAVLALCQRLLRRYGNHRWHLLGTLRLSVIFLRELVLADIAVLRECLARRPVFEPAIYAVPLDARSDTQIGLLSLLVTLTPGTLGLDVSADRSTLYVHALFGRDREAVVNGVKLLERAVSGACR